jgi:hypothetical protein
VLTERDRAVTRRHPAGDGLEQRRLADAVTPKDADDFTGPGVEINALDDVTEAVVGVKSAYG